jgi:hypothetical protein
MIFLRIELDSGMFLEVAFDHLFPDPYSLTVEKHITILFDDIKPLQLKQHN